MPVILKDSYVGRATKETVSPFEKGAWDTLVIGAKSGIKDTTISYYNTITANTRAKQRYEVAGESEISEDQYNDPASGLKVEGLEWEPHMSYEMLYNAKEAQVAAKRFQMEPGGFWSLKTLGAFGGAMFDPVNLIPVPIALAGKSIWKTAGLVAGLNASIELGISPLGYAAYDLRGMEGEYNVLRNMAFAAVLGGAIGSIGPSIGKSLDFARQMNVPENASNVLLRTLPKSRNLNQRLKTLIDAGRFDSPRQINKNTINFSTKGTYFIDDAGLVTTTLPSNPIYAKVVIDETGKVKLSGDMGTIVKASTDIVEGKGVDARIDLEGVTNNKSILTEITDLDQRAFENVVNREGGIRAFDSKYNLDDQKNTGLSFDFDSEFNIVGIKRVIKDNKTGKIKSEERLNPKELDKILDELDPKTIIPIRPDTEKTKLNADEIEAQERQVRTDEAQELQADSKNKTDTEAYLDRVNNKSLQNVRAELNRIDNLETANINKLLYHSMLSNTPKSRLSRLGYEWDEATQTLKKTTPAKDLNTSEKDFLADIKKKEAKLIEANNLDEARIKAMNCARTKI